MYSVKILHYRSKKKEDGTSPLVIRLIRNRKPQYIFLGFYILPEQWDEKNLRVRKSHPNSTRLNIRIHEKMAEVSKMTMNAEDEKRDVTSIQLKATVRNQDLSSFFTLAADYLKDLEKLKKYNQLVGEKSKIKQFKTFLNGNDISFQKITVPLLRKFMIYLKSERGNCEWTVMTVLVVIRTLFNRAIREGLVERKYYPFGLGQIQIKFPESMKIGLNQKEVISFEEADLTLHSPQWNARNIWLCSFYLAGIRISDVVKLRWSDFSDGRLVYIMKKNSKIVSLKVPAKVNEILNLYKYRNSSIYIFPYLADDVEKDAKKLQTSIRNANHVINEHLKAIAVKCGITKKLTMHISRHTFGQIAGDKISPQVLQKLYRHSDLKTTIGYQINFIHRDVDDALDSVVNF